MKKETEIYREPYIGFPIKDSPLLTWLKTLNTDPGKFYHFSIYLLGDMNDNKLVKIKDLISMNADLFKNVVLKPKSLGTFGINEKTSVLRIENSGDLFRIRRLFESKLPEYRAGNLEFAPHISIKRKTGKSFIAKMPDLSSSIENYLPTSIGIFYSPDFMSTALLYSHKIIRP